MALKITEKKNGSSLTLELEGKISVLEAKEFDTAFEKAAEGMKEALLDFSGVEYIASAGLRSLFLAKQTMARQGGEIKILYPREDVMGVFRATRYDNIVTIVERGGEESSARFYPLRPVQRWMVDTHFQMAESTMMNTGALLRLDPAVDMEKLAEAINSLLASYDIFRCRLVLHPDTGDICQRFDGDVAKVYVETLSDEAFEKRKQEVKLPYELIDHPLYRIYLMKTASAKYLYVDFYHAIMDGTAIALLFWMDMDKRYTRAIRGEEIKEKRQPASYAAYILDEVGIPEEELREGHDYWREMLKGFDESRHLPPRDREGAPDTPEHELEVPFPDIEKGFFRGRDFTENTFFIAAAMLALAKSSGQRESLLSWVHNGRMTSAERRLMGLMLNQLPIRWNFDKDMKAGDFLRMLENKITEGMQYRKSLDVVYEEGMEVGLATFILQKGSMGRRGVIKLGGTKAFIEEMPANDISAAENTLDIEMNSHDDGTYSLVLDYDNHRYTEGAMRNFAAIMAKIACALQDGEASVTAMLEE
ncbi:MAG: STAS domain-containing protein [Fretibacterium sp.]|nr:STAS domain-containing protein [Fretibacterium sp.]